MVDSNYKHQAIVDQHRACASKAAAAASTANSAFCAVTKANKELEAEVNATQLMQQILPGQIMPGGGLLSPDAEGKKIMGSEARVDLFTKLCANADNIHTLIDTLKSLESKMGKVASELSRENDLKL